MQSRIFDEFHQGAADTEVRFGGSGLGLHICKSFVTLMQGKIWCQSNNELAHGAGSTFIFEIPLPIAQEENTPPLFKPLLSNTPIIDTGMVPRARQAVLIVDDYALNLSITQKLMTKQFPQFLVQTSTDPYQCEGFFQAHPAGILLLDLNMGDYPTEQIAENLRLQFPHARLIAYTADTSAIARYQDQGPFHHVLIKPFDTQAFSKWLASN